MAISERTAVSTKSTQVSDTCFNDWKRFCFVLRAILTHVSIASVRL